MLTNVEIINSELLSSHMMAHLSNNLWSNSCNKHCLNNNVNIIYNAYKDVKQQFENTL